MTVLTSGIGSVPFRDPEEAVAHVFARYTMPFLPQLPQHPAATPGGLPAMVAEVLTDEMLDAVVARDAARFDAALGEALTRGVRDVDLARMVALPAFLDAAARAAPAWVKAQMVGPCTADLVIETHFAEPLRPSLLSRWLHLLASSLVARIHAATPRSKILFLYDDGALPLTASASYDAIFAVPHATLTGLHTCAPTDVAAYLARFPGRALAMDLCVTPLAAHVDLAAQHVARGGTFLYGVVDTRPDRDDAPSASDLAALPSPLALTGGCGTGLRDVPFERTLAATLSRRGASIRGAPLA